MGQIIGSAAKPKRCNLNKLSQLATPAAGEHILVSSDNSMNAAGQGNFDCYIVGDGRTAATALELKKIEPIENNVALLENKMEAVIGILGEQPNAVIDTYINLRGEEIHGANSTVIGFLPYYTGEDVVWTYGGYYDYYRLCFFDTDKQFITGSAFIPVSGSRNRSISASDIQTYAPNAAYLKASVYSNAEDAGVKIGNKTYKPIYEQAGLLKQVNELEAAVEDMSARVDGTENEIQTIQDNIGNLNTSDIDDLLLFASFNYPPKGRYQQTFGQRKIAQLVQLQWTPKGSIPLRNGSSITSPQTGLIYSETMEIDKFVGYDVSIHTFMTAVNNPHSVLYTENISASRSRSAYGITYHGDGNSGAYYGSVCNTLALMGSSPIIHPNTQEIWGGRCPYFFLNDDQSVHGCHIGDVVGKSGHTLVISDVEMDNDGVIIRVQISEENGIKAAVKGWYNETEFKNFLSANNYTVGKLSLMLTNSKYEPSPYIPLDGESLPSVEYNDDICTMYGDKPCLKESDILVIHYVKGNYTEMEIYKDDVLIDTKTLSSSASDYAIDLTGNSYGYGMFKARLIGSEIQSDYTYWEVIDVHTILLKNVLSVSSANGTILYWEWCNKQGLSWQQTLIKDNSINVGERQSNYPFLKVHIGGEYGRISAIVEDEQTPVSEIIGDVLGNNTYVNKTAPAGITTVISFVANGHAGLYMTDERYVTSPFIAVPSNRQFNIKFGQSGTGIALQEYASEKIYDFVAGDTAWVNSAAERSITVSSGARFVRVTILNSKNSGYGIYDSNNNPLWVW